MAGFACYNAHAQGNEYKLDKTYKISPTGTIELHSDDANVQITGTDRSDVHVKVFYRIETHGITFGERDFEMVVTENDGDLLLRERSEGSTGVMFGSVSEEYEITIYAPVGVSIKLRGDDDDYKIYSVNGAISITADDSDVDIRDCKGNHFEFDLDDGDLEMDGGSGFLYLRSDDGDFIVRNGNFSEVNASLDDGDLLLETSLSDNGNYTFKIDDGSIDFRVTNGGGDFDISHDDGRVTAGDEFQVLEQDENNTLLRLSNGTAKLRFRTNDGRIRLSKR